MKLLAVMSHPDDAEVWAGGTLAKWVTCGHSAHVAVMTYGEADVRGGGCQRCGCVYNGFFPDLAGESSRHDFRGSKQFFY